MRSKPSKSLRARRFVGLVVGSAVAVAGVGWSGAAWGATRSPARTHHASAGHAAVHKRHRPKLPVVSNATNLQREPVVHPSRGKPPKKLEVKNLVVGTGAAVTASSTVSVVYVGASYVTGKDFTRATWASGHVTTFPITGVVQGFAEGLLRMKVGGRREIVIPPKLGYGDHKYGPIKAKETLVFVVDLKAVSG